MNDCPDINNFVNITVKYIARALCVWCWSWWNLLAGKKVCVIWGLQLVCVFRFWMNYPTMNQRTKTHTDCRQSTSWCSSTIATSSSSINFFLDIVETITERRTTRTTTRTTTRKHRLDDTRRQGGLSLDHSLCTGRHMWLPCVHNYTLLFFNRR